MYSLRPVEGFPFHSKVGNQFCFEPSFEFRLEMKSNRIGFHHARQCIQPKITREARRFDDLCVPGVVARRNVPPVDIKIRELFGNHRPQLFLDRGFEQFGVRAEFLGLFHHRRFEIDGCILQLCEGNWGYFYPGLPKTLAGKNRFTEDYPFPLSGIHVFKAVSKKSHFFPDPVVVAIYYGRRVLERNEVKLVTGNQRQIRWGHHK
mmetsp:Transcript_19448/g.40044  ORF Transcript_19448/g.40044 Transcript_19448/m.40044 type:complete len:205 (-) Transcript_19448:1245-1859(-)